MNERPAVYLRYAKILMLQLVAAFAFDPLRKLLARLVLAKHNFGKIDYTMRGFSLLLHSLDLKFFACFSLDIDKSLQLCVNVQIPRNLRGLGGAAVYIDTNRGFSIKRIRGK